MARLAGKVAVITGASSGFGRASAIRFAEEGASVVVADITEQPLTWCPPPFRATPGSRSTTSPRAPRPT